MSAREEEAAFAELVRKDVVKRETWPELDEYLRCEAERFFALKHFGTDPAKRCPDPSIQDVNARKVGQCSQTRENYLMQRTYVDVASQKYAFWKENGYTITKSRSRAYPGTDKACVDQRTEQSTFATMPKDYVELAAARFKRQREVHSRADDLTLDTDASKSTRFNQSFRAWSGNDSKENEPYDCVYPEILRAYVEQARVNYRAYISDSSFRSGQLSPLSTAPMSRSEELSVCELYGGSPDEVYRRKSSKKYAAYKRMVREREAEEASRLGRAEAHRRRVLQRQGDRLRTTEHSEQGFRTMRFCNENTAYAFSASITQNHKHRDSMIGKYLHSAQHEKAPEKDSFEIAEECARTKPMFHTRVMNRFM